MTGDLTNGATGKACFFSAAGAGTRTAGGERVHAEGLVAAHAAFPLGSQVKVTNLSNGKSVEVRIINRFPVSSRIISVSESAARQLGFLQAGTAEVRVELAPQRVTAPERQSAASEVDSAPVHK